MATITSNTFLDGGVARTAGEAWTMNGGVLTVRTDTRVHANAPASMLGSIGATTISATLGGGVLIDGRNVRWMPYNSGSGNVPAIGTLVTQGGVSGYLLGVWASLTSAPTAVGAAMPATGFLKFREVTGGAYSAGALTNIGASAVSPDVVGWIEVVQDQAVANTVPRLGYFRTRGDWFYLDDTTGAAGQVLQVPTNGGGAGTHVPAVWIETGVGTNVYEIYPAVEATYYLAANLSTDVRSKFVQTIGTGQIRIGRDAAVAAAGYVPPAGCRVRIPNVLGRQTSAANRALNLVPNATLATRPDFTTTSAGEIDFEYFMNDWYHLFTAPYKVRMVNCATFDIHTTSNEASPTELDNYCVGVYTGTSITLTGTNNPLGGTITDCAFPRGAAAANGHSISMTGCSGHEFDNVSSGVIAYARNTGAVVFSQCRNMTFNDFVNYCATFSPSTCANFNITNFTYIDRLLGTTIATTSKYAIAAAISCDNIFVDGISFGSVADVNPYAAVVNASNCTNLTFRNAGTQATPLDCHATNSPNYIFVDSGNNDGVRFQRIYLETVRANLFTAVNTSKNFLMENIHVPVGTVQTVLNDTLLKGVRAAANSVAGAAAVYGTHWFDMFTSNTAGRIWLAFNEPTAFSADQYQAMSLGAGAGFTSAGQIVMPNLGDQIIFTMPYFVIGHTALANIAPTITGTNTGNFTFEYDIDTGSGFSGTYKTLNATNLSGETVSPTDGFKLRYRITVATANAANALTYICINTVSTLVAQTAGLYPMDLTTISLTGLVAGSRVQLYDVTNATEIYNAVVNGSSLSYSTPYVADFDCRVRVMKQSGVTAYEILEFTQLVGIDGFTRAVAQEIDVVYGLNGIDGSTVTGITIDDAALLVEIDTGVLSWADIYAYETYWLYTEQGIRDETRFIEAIDPANYILTDFKIKNVSFPTAPLTIVDGWGRDSVTGETVTLIDTTGGTIFSNPDLVIAYATSGGGGGASAADVWSYSTRTLTSGSAPSAATVAAAVRTELTTELATIGTIDAKTTNLPSDPADQSVILAAIAALPAITTSDIRTELSDELLEITEMHKIAGLDILNPMTVTPSSRVAGTISLTLTGDGTTTTTVTRD